MNSFRLIQRRSFFVTLAAMPLLGMAQARLEGAPPGTARPQTAFVAQPAKPAVSQTNSLIVLDPGHGGTTKVGGSSPNNATGPAGLKEKDVTLQVALKAKAELLKRGYQVLLTRDTNVNIGLQDRAAVARQNQAKAFISIHFNGNDSQAVQGTEVWVHSNSQEPSKRFGSFMQQRVAAATSYRDRGLKSGDYGVLNATNHLQATACCLVEVSFMTQASEEKRLKDSAYIAKVSSALADSVDDFVRRKSRGPVPEPIPAIPDDLENQ